MLPLVSFADSAHHYHTWKEKNWREKEMWIENSDWRHWMRRSLFDKHENSIIQRERHTHSLTHSIRPSFLFARNLVLKRHFSFTMLNTIRMESLEYCLLHRIRRTWSKWHMQRERERECARVIRLLYFPLVRCSFSLAAHQQPQHCSLRMLKFQAQAFSIVDSFSSLLTMFLMILQKVSVWGKKMCCVAIKPFFSFL